MPFEVPEGWEWIAIGDYVKAVTDFVASGSFATLRQNVRYYKEPNYAILVRTQDFQSGFSKGLVYTDEHGYEFLSNSNLYGGELILPNIGASIGKVFVVPILNKKMTLAPNSIMLRFWECQSQPWVEYYFRSPQGQSALFSISSATAQGKFNKTDFKDLLIPVPPLGEQKRICCQVNTLLAAIEDIENGRKSIGALISNAKAKILELAIHGKLVPQVPTEEPALELLKRINPAFQPSYNLHYVGELPTGWAFAKIESFCSTINGLWKGTKEPLKNVGVIRNANFTKDFTLDYSNIEYIDVEERSFARRNLEDGDIIVEKSGGSDNFPVGRSILYRGESNKFSFSNFTMSLRIKDKSQIMPEYLFYALQQMYRRGRMKEMQTQTTGLHNLLTDVFLTQIIPIPPICEQHRIVAIVDELFRIINRIKDIQ